MNKTSELNIDFARSPSPRKKQKKSKVFQTVLLVNVILIALIIAIGLLTPAFRIHEITVTGTQYLTPSKIIDASQLTVGRNIFTFRTGTVSQGIASLPFVDSVKVTREYPDKVSLIISECKPLAQVMCGDSLFIVVDHQGKILDTTSESAKYGVPVIEGVAVEQFEVGQVIDTLQTEEFETLLQLAKELAENNMIDLTAGLSLRQDNFLITFQNGVVCNIGPGKNSSYKIRFLKEVIGKIPSGKTGTVEFIDEYKAVFKENE